MGHEETPLEEEEFLGEFLPTYQQVVVDTDATGKF
jgi:hypothetical protein